MKNINCFSNEGDGWKKSNIYYNEYKLNIKFKEKFIFRRGRVNCSLNDNGIWKWFGIQFTIEQD